MEKLVIEFDGHIEIDKNDIVITTISKDGNMVKVDTTNLNSKEIIEGVDNGIYFVSLENCFQFALDGETNINVDVEL